MSKKILLRADDLGYSEAVNYGIEKTIKDGLIRSLGVMVNMTATKHGVDLIKDCDIALGLHTNISAGRPLTNTNLIPSLVDKNGFFKSSQVFRTATEDFLVLDQVILEIEAQYKKFIELFDRKPDYFEGHAVQSATFFKGLEIFSDKYKLKYSGVPLDEELIHIGESKVKFTMESMNSNYQPFEMIKSMVEKAENEIVQLAVFHPGYLDDYILKNSSLTIPRTQEVTVLTSQETKIWLQEQGVVLVDYREI